MYNIFKFLTHTPEDKCAAWKPHGYDVAFYHLVFWSCLCISVSANVDSEAQNQQSWIPPGSCWAERDMVQPTADPHAFPFPLFNCKQTINIFTSDVSVETLIVGVSCFEWQSLLLYSLLFTIIF